MLYAGEEGTQVEAAAFHDLHVWIGRGIDYRELSLSLPAGEVPAETHHVLPNVLRRFLECHEDAVLIEVGDASDKKLNRKDCLAAARGAGHQRRPIDRNTALGDDVKARDP